MQERPMRKRHCRLCLILAVCVWSLVSQPLASDEETTARLTRQIDALATFFPPGGSQVPPATLADSLIEGKARVQLFRLESLLRLYSRAHRNLQKYWRAVKDLEDGLGAYTFAVD